MLRLKELKEKFNNINMDDSFIIFIPNPPSISKLTSSGKQSQWSNIRQDLEKLIENYKKFYNHKSLKLNILN